MGAVPSADRKTPNPFMASSCYFLKTETAKKQGIRSWPRQQMEEPILLKANAAKKIRQGLAARGVLTAANRKIAMALLKSELRKAKKRPRTHKPGKRAPSQKLKRVALAVEEMAIVDPGLAVAAVGKKVKKHIPFGFVGTPVELAAEARKIREENKREGVVSISPLQRYKLQVKVRCKALKACLRIVSKGTKKKTPNVKFALKSARSLARVMTVSKQPSV